MLNGKSWCKETRRRGKMKEIWWDRGWEMKVRKFKVSHLLRSEAV